MKKSFTNNASEGNFIQSPLNLGLVETEGFEHNFILSTHYEDSPKVSTFGGRLKELLKDKKIKKTELGRIISQKLGREKPISRQSITLYEKNKISPPVNVIEAMAEVFQVSVDYLLGYKNSPSKADQYISESLGLNQYTIDYLRSRKQTLDKVISNNNKKNVPIRRLMELESLGRLMEKDELKEYNKLKKEYPDRQLKPEFISDSIIDIVNFLINDMGIEGKKLLHDISCFLYPEGYDSLIAVNQPQMDALLDSIKEAKSEATTVKRFDKAIDNIMVAYKNCFSDNKQYTERAQVSYHLLNIEDKLRKLRMSLNVKNPK